MPYLPCILTGAATKHCKLSVEPKIAVLSLQINTDTQLAHQNRVLVHGNRDGLQLSCAPHTKAGLASCEPGTNVVTHQYITLLLVLSRGSRYDRRKLYTVLFFSNT